MCKSVSPTEQVTQVANLLGRAVLRWKREKESSPGFSEIVSNSLTKRLDSSSFSLLSVTGQNDGVEDLGETGSQTETLDAKDVRRATTKDRDVNRRRNLPACRKNSQPRNSVGE